MAQNIASKGFSVEYRIHEIRSIKLVTAGEMKDKDTGKSISYDASVQFKTFNIDQVNDEKLGLTDRETTLIFKILLENDNEIKALNNWLRAFDTSTNPLIVVGSIPKLSDRDTYIVTSSLSAKELMSLNSKQKS